MTKFIPTPGQPFSNEYFSLLNQIFSEDDPRPAKEQIQERYSYGGGWNPFQGHQLTGDWGTLGGASLSYPGDPAQPEIARAKLHDETLILFKYSWLAVVQPDGSFEVNMMD